MAHALAGAKGTLSSISLDCCVFAAGAIAAFATALAGNRALTKLRIDGCALSSEDLKAIAASLQINRTLVSLHVSEMDGDRLMADAMSFWTMLQTNLTFHHLQASVLFPYNRTHANFFSVLGFRSTNRATPQGEPGIAFPAPTVPDGEAGSLASAR